MTTTTRIILIALAFLASLYFLWPTYHFYQLESERAPLKNKLEDTSKVRTAKDTLALRRWDTLNGDAYRSAAEHRIKLGLDLRGGMYLTLEVDVPTLLQESAQRDAVDDLFEQVIAQTRKEATNSDDPVIDIFQKYFDQIARPKGRTLLSYFDVGNLGNDASDKAIVEKLKRNINDAVDQAEEVVRRRVDPNGVSEVTITKQAGRRLVLELPGANDEGYIRNLLQTTARLEFKLVKNDVDAVKLFKKIDGILAAKNVTTGKDSATSAKKPDSTKAKPDSTKAKPDSTKAKPDSAKGKTDSTKTDSTKKPVDTSNPYAGLPQEEAAKRYRADHPFSSLFLTRVSTDEASPQQDIVYIGDDFPKGEYYFYVPKSQIATVKELLARPDIKGLLPDDVVIAFGNKSEGAEEKKNDENALFAMYVLSREAELTGEVITDARPEFDPMGRQAVSMSMNADGADRWAVITGKNIKKRVAIVLDSAVYSAPVVQNKISGGVSQITGSKDAKEATLLSVVLKAGALKAPVKIIEERIVGPSLGEDSINEGIRATAIAALLVIIFMMVYYSFGGVIADLAVLLNVLITLAALATLGATLTLPGIGGLVLTIGMAVDGNILIYERTREELMSGKSLKTSVDLGYKKAFAAIIDTHITTFLTGGILYLIGTGPIKGFAVTLMIGIAATLFTAVFCTRTVFMLMLERGATNINFGLPKSSYDTAKT